MGYSNQPAARSCLGRHLVPACAQAVTCAVRSLTTCTAMCGRPANDPQLMSYRSYLDSFLLPFRAGHGPEVERHNTDVKNQRQAFKRRFTEPGEPGHMFRSGRSHLTCPWAGP